MSNVTPQNNQPTSDGSLPVISLVLAFLVPIAGAIVGHIALNQMRDGRIVDTNKSLAKAGMILGWVFTGLYVVGIALYAFLFLWIVGGGSDLYM